MRFLVLFQGALENMTQTLEEKLQTIQKEAEGTQTDLKGKGELFFLTRIQFKFTVSHLLFCVLYRVILVLKSAYNTYCYKIGKYKWHETDVSQCAFISLLLIFIIKLFIFFFNDACFFLHFCPKLKSESIDIHEFYFYFN